MLIYNYKKEFLGIDGSDLEIFGLTDLADLRAESADFADLFIKTPGCIHNFKHVHWIDYVLDKNGAEAKVIIHVKNKNYAAKLEITSVYLVDNPSKQAHGVNLVDVKPLSAAQSEKLSNDILNQPAPQSATGSTELFTTPGSIVHDENATNDIHEDIGEASFDPYEVEDSNPNVIADIYENQTQDTKENIKDETPLDVTLDEDEPITQTSEVKQMEDLSTVEDIAENQPEDTSSIMDGDDYDGYVYNPQLASDELGLPIDLIEEFIEDFISQANSFKDEMYQAVEENELDTLKIQSHKLKGVAANLRIEDALDALKIINTSSNLDEITSNLDRFYIMIKTLSHGAVPIEESIDKPEVAIEEDDDNDEMVLSFKDEPGAIKDSDVPQNIEIPELADDDFLNKPIKEEIDSDLDLSILNDDTNTNITESTEELQEEVLDIAASYDKELIANDIGIDIDSFNELLNDYMKEALSLTETITQAAKNNDLALCKTMAIKLKGMSENMRIHKFDDELHSITEASTQDEIISSIENIVLQLKQISDK